MPQAYLVQDGELIDWTANAAHSSGDVIQLPDGRAGVVSVDVENGKTVGVYVCGVFKVAKTTSMVLLTGGRAYWDRSASKVHYTKVNDRDFYLGRIQSDAASADTVCYVALNIDPPYDIDVIRDAFLSVATGTSAAGGFGLPTTLGGAKGLALTGTNEAQCVDLLSVDRFATTAKPIVEATFRVPANGSTNAVDFNIGLANGTSATDADAITESCFIHIDGNDLNLYAESDDGTTEVNATDTTVDFVAGSAVANRIHAWFDARNPASLKLYLNGTRVLSGSTFNMSAATGPWGLLAHLEKSSSTATGSVVVDRFNVRFTE